MYICICRGVTDGAIREAVYQGANRMRDLKACLGVAEQCGLCACHTKQVLDQTRMQKTQVEPLQPTLLIFVSQPSEETVHER